MSYSISELRANIARLTVEEQVRRSVDKVNQIVSGPSPPSLAPGGPPAFAAPGAPTQFLDITQPAPGFEDLDEPPAAAPPPPGFGAEPPKAPPTFPKLLHVGIVGGGMAGLYTAMILKSLKISYEVLEASGRPGGRVWTHRFSDTPGDYYDVGAMRFPDIPIMQRTFKLFEILGITKDKSENPEQGKLIPYYFKGPNNPLYYNNILVKNGEAKEDAFKVSTSNGGMVPDSWVDKGYEKILGDVFDDWRNRFADPATFKATWKELMDLDERATSLRAYMTQKFAIDAEGKPKSSPNSPKELYYVTNWCETMDAATTHYDEAFTSLLLHSLEFKWPAGPQTIDDPCPILDTKTKTTTDDKEEKEEQEENLWWCVNGGADIMATKMVEHLGKQPLYNHRVTAIKRNHPTIITTTNTTTAPNRPMEVSFRGAKTRHYSHVITTCTAACLRTMDLHDAELDYSQREALRVLRYDTAVKIGIKFSKRWWADDKGITQGGLGKTDRPTRVVVYPSYALNTPKGEPGVLLACYNWSEDAARIGSLSDAEALSVILADLAVMHSIPEAELRQMVLSYHVHNWYHDDLTNGAFGFFGPGMYSSLFGRLQRPAAGGNLFFAGEITSIYHGWIVASLNSARRAVYQMLLSQWLQSQTVEEKAYVVVLMIDLAIKWGPNDYEPSSETDDNPKGMMGWQIVLGSLDPQLKKF